MKIKPYLLAAMLLAFTVGTARSQILQHFGSTNPSNEGFNLGSFGNPQAGPVTGDLGLDAWSVDLNCGFDGIIYRRYRTTQEHSDTAGGWAMSVTLRVVEFPRLPFEGIFVRFYTGS